MTNSMHDDIMAMRQALSRLANRAGSMVEVMLSSASLLRAYEKEHLDRDKPEKAHRNGQMAARIEEALGISIPLPPADLTQPVPPVPDHGAAWRDVRTPLPEMIPPSGLYLTGPNATHRWPVGMLPNGWKVSLIESAFGNADLVPLILASRFTLYRFDLPEMTALPPRTAEPQAIRGPGWQDIASLSDGLRHQPTKLFFALPHAVANRGVEITDEQAKAMELEHHFDLFTGGRLYTAVLTITRPWHIEVLKSAGFTHWTYGFVGPNPSTMAQPETGAR